MNDLLVTMADDAQYLCHYGVIGMKWGVRNAETLRKYRSGNGGQVSKKKSSSGGSRFERVSKSVGRGLKDAGSRALGVPKAVFRKAADQRAKRKQIDKLMDDAGARKKRQKEAFERAREQTLSSHDPETVFKGAYTLTDEELGLKIARLKKEGELLDMASSRKQAAAKANTEAQNALRAKRQADEASLKGRIQSAAIDAVKTVVVDAGKSATQRVLDINLPKPTKDKKKSDNKEEASVSDKKDDEPKNNTSSFPKAVSLHDINAYRVDTANPVAKTYKAKNSNTKTVVLDNEVQTSTSFKDKLIDRYVMKQRKKSK